MLRQPDLAQPPSWIPELLPLCSIPGARRGCVLPLSAVPALVAPGDTVPAQSGSPLPSSAPVAQHSDEFGQTLQQTPLGF